MRSGYLVFPLILLMVFSFAAISQSTDKPIDYQSLVAGDGSNVLVSMGHAFDNYGPYTAFDKIWVFYANGQDAVWRTKQVEAADSEWSFENNIFQETHSSYFNVAFDGQYFHFIRSVNGDLKYRRGEAQPDGSIQFDSEVTAYSDPTWQLRTVEGGAPRHFSIAIDHEGNPWVALKVADGNESDSNFKPIATSSVSSDGSWQARDGFPVDLAVAYDARGYGRAPNIAEVAPGEILFTWNHDRRHDPRGLRARLWNNGELGEMEDTGLPRTSASTSLIVTPDGIAMLNSQAEVARRNLGGSWESAETTDMNNSNFNVLTIHNDRVRLWDFDGQEIRYKETQDNGVSWSSLTTKWTTSENVNLMSGTHADGSQGDHHSILWSTGESPYDIYMGIEGTIPHPNPPTLVSPSDGTENIEEDVTLVWNTIDVAHSYIVQVATDGEFSQLQVNETVESDTSLEVTGLDLNVLHYWRVRARIEGGAESDWSAVWTFGTVGEPPAPQLASPDDEPTDQPTTVTFSWHHTAGAEEYRLQLATVSDFSATFADVDGITDTSVTVSGLDHERTYYWRVRGSNELGDGEWSQVRSFTTMPAVPAPPILVSPDDGDIDLSTTLTLTWEDSPNADSYRLQVSKESNFASTVFNQGNITSTSYEINILEHSTTYYWRVSAVNESGTGNWSSVWSFTTIIETPEIPVLVSPADGADEVSTKPEFDWEVAERADIYRIQIATAVEFDSILVDADEIEGTMYSVTEELDPFTTYYWRVNASNIGGTSDWSDGWAFETGQAFPVAPVLESPDDGSTGLETEVMVLWNAVPTATHYHVQLADNNNFETPVVDNDGISNTFFTVSELDTATQYYWRVRAISDVGAGDWSSTWSFTTKDVTSVRELAGGIPDEFNLQQNYPNPFNPTTTIRFGLPEASAVRLDIYNMIGQRVATLIDGEHYTAGTYEAMWDARDEMGREMSSGMYIYRITAGEYVNVKKMLLMK